MVMVMMVAAIAFRERALWRIFLVIHQNSLLLK